MRGGGFRPLAEGRRALKNGSKRERVYPPPRFLGRWEGGSDCELEEVARNKSESGDDDEDDDDHWLLWLSSEGREARRRARERE